MLDPTLASTALSGDGKDAEEGRLAAVEAAVVSDILLAADTARMGLEKGITDVRLITAYTLGLFVEQGPKTLAASFDVLRSAVAERWQSLRPTNRKDRVVDGAYAGLFRSIVNYIDVHEKMQDATFKLWLRSDHDTVGGPALRASAALREALELAIETSRARDTLSELDVRIRTLFDRVPAPVRAPAPPPAPVEDESDDTDQAPSSTSDATAVSETASNVAASDAPSSTAETMKISAAFAEFLRKLQVFEALVQRGETSKAAVVADDVRRTLKSFDPKVFFPDKLAPYFQTLSDHIDEISPYWDEIGSPRWEALEQLYQVNLENFAKGGPG